MSQNSPQPPDAKVEIKLGDSEQSIEFPAEGLTMSCPVTKLGDRLYRLDGVAWSESAAFQDVIEAEDLGNGKLRFVRVVKSSGWKTYDYVTPRGSLDDERGVALLRELDAKGLYWERILGGVLFVCVPPHVELDPTALVNAAVRPVT